jgi:hypothetical protein
MAARVIASILLEEKARQRCDARDMRVDREVCQRARDF